MPTLSVVIVTYQSAAHLRPTLQAVLTQDHPAYEVILLDNASTDDSLAIARTFEPQGLRVIANPVNRGYAGGNNDAVAAARGALIVLLNPDAELREPAALRCIEAAFAMRPAMGILGAKLLDPDGVTVQHCGGQAGIPAHCVLFGRGERDAGQWSMPLPVEFVIGALLAIPRALWRRLGGFDEFYNPAYYEDTDLCWRCRSLGLEVVCWPAVTAIHHENVSTEYKSAAFYWMHHKGRIWYQAKNWPLTTLLWRGLPAECAWFASAGARYHRRMLLGLYWMILKRTVKRRLLGLGPLNETTVAVVEE